MPQIINITDRSSSRRPSGVQPPTACYKKATDQISVFIVIQKLHAFIQHVFIGTCIHGSVHACTTPFNHAMMHAALEPCIYRYMPALIHAYMFCDGNLLVLQLAVSRKLKGWCCGLGNNISKMVLQGCGCGHAGRNIDFQSTTHHCGTIFGIDTSTDASKPDLKPTLYSGTA